MSIFNRRSPISPKALTVGDLKKLREGTQLIQFSRADNKGTRVVFRAVYVGKGGARVGLYYPDAQFTDLASAADLGLEPYSPRNWNDNTCLVLPEDVAALPTKPNVAS